MVFRTGYFEDDDGVQPGPTAGVSDSRIVPHYSNSPAAAAAKTMTDSSPPKENIFII